MKLLLQRSRTFCHLAVLAFGMAGSAWGQSHPPFLDEHWNGHFGVIKIPPESPTNNWRAIGSAFVFGPKKEVVTCAHVMVSARMRGFTNLFYVTQGTGVRELKLKYILPRYDLAVFDPTPAVEGKPMVIADFKKMRPGDKIHYYGLDSRYSTPELPAAMMNEGVVSAIGSALNEGTTIDFLEFEGRGIPGYSGGPVFNERGELVALMREAWTKKGVNGGQEILVNRAFSLEVLKVLEGEVFTGFIPETSDTNKPGLSLLDILETPNVGNLGTNGSPKH
jgi:S1-C subfamily serine protease